MLSYAAGVLRRFRLGWVFELGVCCVPQGWGGMYGGIMCRVGSRELVDMLTALAQSVNICAVADRMCVEEPALLDAIGCQALLSGIGYTTKSCN